MASQSSASRTNLSSSRVIISNKIIGEGTFRVALEGTYVGGNRNQQEAACKRFKSQYRNMEDEYFSNDFKIVDKAIDLAEDWNDITEEDEKILMTKGDIKHSNSGIPYLVEPFIRFYTKYNSNSGWISDDEGWQGKAMEAFSHFTYHQTGGQLIVCDIQGRYRYNQYNRRKCRFELTDPAICSRRRSYGVTDLGEKGIESFFTNHVCNQFCNVNGTWSKPRSPSQWFPSSSGTSMISSRLSNKLCLSSPATFRLNQDDIIEEDSDCDY